MKPAPRRVKGNLREIIVKWPPYNFKVACVIGPQKHLGPYLKYRQHITHDHDPDAKGVYYQRRTHCRRGVLWLPSIPRTAKQINVLTHEMTHAVLDMFRFIGLPNNVSTEETLCYSIAHGVEEVLKAVRK